MSRHEEFLKRHLARHAKKKAAEDSDDDREETAAFFWDAFNAKADALQAVLSSEAEPAEKLAEASSLLSSLREKVANASLWLAAYDQRRAAEEIEALGSKVEVVRKASQPRKKFSFASRRRAAAAAAAAAAAQVAAAEGPADGAAEVGESAPVRTAADESDAPAVGVPGFQDRRGATLVHEVVSGADLPRDFLVDRLESCDVLLTGGFRALRLQNLRDCVVFGGCVTGPVYVEDCAGCSFFLCAQQLRIHRTAESDFHVKAVAGPIIEGCSGLVFGPIDRAHRSLRGHLAEHGMLRKPNLWRDVKDFRWLKAQQSPHFSLVGAGGWGQSERLARAVGGLGDGGHAVERLEEGWDSADGGGGGEGDGDEDDEDEEDDEM